MPALKREIPDAALLDLADGCGLRPTARAHALPHETLRRAAATPEGKARTAALVRERRTLERQRRAAVAGRRAEQKAARAAQRQARQQQARPAPARGGAAATDPGRPVPPLELQRFSDAWLGWYENRRLLSENDWLNSNDARRGIVPPFERRARERAAAS